MARPIGRLYMVKVRFQRLLAELSPILHLMARFGCFILKVDFLKKLGTLRNPFAPGNFAEKRCLKLVERFSGHCRAIKS